MAKIRIEGKEYDLRLNMWAMERMEQEFGDASEALEKFRKEKKLSTVRKMFVILANAGRIHAKAEPDVEESVLYRCSLGDLEQIAKVQRAALDEGLKAETVGGNEADDSHEDAFAAALEAREKKD